MQKTGKYGLLVVKKKEVNRKKPQDGPLLDFLDKDFKTTIL